jgi:DNA-directed RNA polymerase subunit RPC12/RpoP
VEDSHGQPCGALLSPESARSERSKLKDSPCKSEVWYIPEECMPEWISCNLDKGDWVKGKVNCPQCGSRVGSYNFVSGIRCPCGSKVGAYTRFVGFYIGDTDTYVRRVFAGRSTYTHRKVKSGLCLPVEISRTLRRKTHSTADE